MAAADNRNCPICARPAATRYRPFCSKRCADIDLGRWLEGSYRLPAVEPPGEFDADDAPPPQAPGNGGEQ